MMVVLNFSMQVLHMVQHAKTCSTPLLHSKLTYFAWNEIFLGRVSRNLEKQMNQNSLEIQEKYNYLFYFNHLL
jgi:hypothetical protein